MSLTFSRRSNRAADCVSPVRWLLIALIYLYRYSFGPHIGHSCRFHPSCSHYAEEALSTHGAWRGSILAVRRLLKCHPWHDGGFDPVPDAASELSHTVLTHKGNSHRG